MRPSGVVRFVVGAPLIVALAGGEVAGQARVSVGDQVHVSTASASVPVVEAHLAVHPRDPTRLLAAAIVLDSAQTGVWEGSRIETYASDDGGGTWRTTRLDMLSGADPWLTIDSDGNAYLAHLGRVGDGGAVELWTRRSSDAGATWGPGRSLGVNHDRETMVSGVVDGVESTFLSSSLGTRAASGSTVAYVYVARARDGGPLVPIVQALPSNLLSNTFSMAVTRRGRLIVSLLDYATGSFEMLGARRAWTLALGHGGTSLSEPRLVSEDIAPRTEFTIAADPSAAFAEDRLYALRLAEGAAGAEIRLTHSDDLGRTWSDDRVVAGPETNARPAGPRTLVVLEDGTLVLAWFDRRHGPDDRSVDLFVTASIDGGDTFVPAARVTAATSRNDVPANGRAHERWGQGGDYFGLVALADRSAQLLWSDSRSGVYQLYTARVSLEGTPAPR